MARSSGSGVMRTSSPVTTGVTRARRCAGNSRPSASLPSVSTTCSPHWSHSRWPDGECHTCWDGTARRSGSSIPFPTSSNLRRWSTGWLLGGFVSSRLQRTVYGCHSGCRWQVSFANRVRGSPIACSTRRVGDRVASLASVGRREAKGGAVTGPGGFCVWATGFGPRD